MCCFECRYLCIIHPFCSGHQKTTALWLGHVFFHDFCNCAFPIYDHSAPLYFTFHSADMLSDGASAVFPEQLVIIHSGLYNQFYDHAVFRIYQCGIDHVFLSNQQHLYLRVGAKQQIKICILFLSCVYFKRNVVCFILEKIFS